MPTGLLDRCLIALLNLVLAAIVAISGAEVFSRYALGASISWAFEASLSLLAYLTFIGGYVALRTRTHLRVDFILRKLPFAGQVALFLLCQGAVGLIAWVMTVWGWDQAFKYPGQKTPVMGVPMSWLYVIVPISGAAMLAHVLWDTWLGLRRAMRGLPPEDFTAGSALDELGSV